MRLTTVLLLAATALAAACGTDGGDVDPVRAAARVEDARVRLPAVAGRPGAAYFTLHAGLGNDRLLAVETPAAGRTEMHESAMANGAMTMRKLDAVDLTPGTPVVFSPGGTHAMLFDLAPGVAPGATVPIRLRLASGETVSGQARVLAAGDSGQ